MGIMCGDMEIYARGDSVGDLVDQRGKITLLKISEGEWVHEQ